MVYPVTGDYADRKLTLVISKIFQRNINILILILHNKVVQESSHIPLIDGN